MRFKLLLVAASALVVAFAWVASIRDCGSRGQAAVATQVGRDAIASSAPHVDQRNPSEDAAAEAVEQADLAAPRGSNELVAAEVEASVKTASATTSPEEGDRVTTCAGRASIWGRVFDVHHKPAENALLRVEHGDLVDPCVHETRTGWDGRYLYSELPAGPMRVVERHGVDFAEERVQYVVLETTTDVRLDFGLPPPPRRWRGRVTTRGGVELPSRFTIQVRNVETRRHATLRSAVGGSFEIELEAGLYEVTISYPTFESFPNVDLRSGNLRHDLVLSGVVVFLDLEFVDSDAAAPESKPHVWMTLQPGDEERGRWYDVVEAGDGYVGYGVAPDRYRIKLSSQRFEFAEATDADRLVDVYGDSVSVSVKLKWKPR